MHFISRRVKRVFLFVICMMSSMALRYSYLSNFRCVEAALRYRGEPFVGGTMAVEVNIVVVDRRPQRDTLFSCFFFPLASCLCACVLRWCVMEHSGYNRGHDPEGRHHASLQRRAHLGRHARACARPRGQGHRQPQGLHDPHHGRGQGFSTFCCVQYSVFFFTCRSNPSKFPLLS